MKYFFLTVFCSLSLLTFAQKKSSSAKEVIARVFKEYVKYNESVDSKQNKEAVKKACGQLQKKFDATALPVLLNAWMYYDPTDFGTRSYINPIFEAHKKETIKAINYRIKHKRKNENKETAPYSELFELKEKLSK